MVTKYLRALPYTTGTNGRDIPIFMRVCYEFWGYCVNNNNPIRQITAATNATPIQITTDGYHGLITNQLVGISGVLGNTAANGQFIVTVINSTQFTLNGSVGNGAYTGDGKLSVPGGMPITPVSAPAGFFEGTTVVLTTGTDGVTHDLGINFESPSANFPISYIGKHITIWEEGSESTDDSIYKIINVPSSTQLMLSPFSGGSRDISTLKNNLTSRSFLNYRIVDFTAASQLAVASGNYFVGTFTDGYSVNTGQANSQFQFLLRGSSTPFGQFGMVGSPAGTWTGSAFTGATITEQTPASTNFTGTTTNVNGSITLIGDKTFFLGHIRSSNSNAASGLYFYNIIPQRLYTQAQDLNPLTILVGGNALTAAAATDSHSTDFAMVHFDNVTRLCQLMTRNFVGDGVTGTNFTAGPNLSVILLTQSRQGKVLYTDAIMSHIVTSGQFSLARAKLRAIAFTSATLPSFHLVGDNGEFIHVGNGVLWPWDGSVMPYSLLPLGT